MGENVQVPLDDVKNDLVLFNKKPSYTVQNFIDESSDPLNSLDKSSDPLNSSETVPTNNLDKPNQCDEEILTIKIVYKKDKYDLNLKKSTTIGQLKSEVSKLTGLHSTLQKIVFKGPTKDDQTLKDLSASNGSKFMVIGSTLNDILSIRPPDKTTTNKEEDINSQETNTLSKQKIHSKILEKGQPEDAMIGLKNINAPLPLEPLTGMLERGGGKVRLTFKLELDQLWIGTKDRTQKIPLSSIVTIVSEPIAGHEEYLIMGIQLGPTEASRYWIYWVPAQYFDAIKKAVFQ